MTSTSSSVEEGKANRLRQCKIVRLPARDLPRWGRVCSMLAHHKKNKTRIHRFRSFFAAMRNAMQLALPRDSIQIQFSPTLAHHKSYKNTSRRYEKCLRKYDVSG